MKDKHFAAQPGDNADDGSDIDAAELPGPASRPLEMPRKADLTRPDQARRSRPVPPDSRSASSIDEAASKSGATARIPAARKIPGSQAHPISKSRPASGGEPITEPEPTPVRLASPHPLARLRLGESGPGRPRIGLPGFGGSGRRAAVAGRPTVSRRGPGLQGLRLPSLRNVFAFTGIAATLAVVASLLMTLPSQPAAPASTGSVYQISWRSAAKPPDTAFEFGPYFTSFGDSLLMLGTKGSTTTVWSSDDGSTWSQVSGSGAFDISGRRFVAQGLSDDGSGGLVAVGNSLGSSSTDVIASAWRSRDGRTWIPTEVDSSTGQEMIGGAVTRPGAVVTAGNGVAWFSPDGQRWTPHVLPGAQNFIPRAVGSWDGGFAIVELWNGDGAPRSAVWYSTTGRDWIKATTSLDGFDARGIAGSGGRIVIVGSDTDASAEGLAASWTSTDGKTWVKASAPSDQPQTAMDGVTVVDGSFVAVGAADKNLAGTATQGTQAALAVWVSEDGTSWLPITTAAQPLTHGRMAAVAGRVVLVGGSSDGLGVLAGDVTLGPARMPSSSPSAPPQFALKLTAGDTPMIVDVGASDVLGPVATTDSKFFTFVTQPAGTSIWSSDNGSLWAQELGPDALVTSDNNGRPVVLQAVNDGVGGVIAIGRVTSSSGDTGTIWRLPKGGKWHQASLGDPAPPEFSSISAGPSGFVVASDKTGGSSLMYSTDGETWDAASISVATGYSLTVGTYRFGFVATGSDSTRQGVSTAWTSPDGRTWTLRTDWHLPVNVIQAFGIGAGLVAITSGSGIAPSSSASPATSPAASPAASSSVKPTPTAKPTPAPTGGGTPANTWWWSSTGVKWQQTGFQTSGGNWAIVNGQILALDVPVQPASSWIVWSSPDGKNWQRPVSDPLAFGGSTSCRIASTSSQIVVVGWAAKGQLKDYFGSFASR
ncbi:MAG: hypothetical protein ABSE70_09070 [Candidatus Limnocylindrales bacterium]